MLKISQEILDRLMLEAKSEAPKECGGLLTGEIHVTGIEPIPNQAFLASIIKRYNVSGQVLFNRLLQIEQQGLLPVAFYHSHPSEHNSRMQLSKEDLEARHWIRTISPISVITTPLDVWAYRLNAIAIKGLKINGLWGGREEA